MTSRACQWLRRPTHLRRNRRPTPDMPGAQQEGIVRHERIMPDGRKRNSVRFSIIDEEWPQVRQALESKLSDIARR